MQSSGRARYFTSQSCFYFQFLTDSFSFTTVQRPSPTPCKTSELDIDFLRTTTSSTDLSVGARQAKVGHF
ncbi:hypothetical protein L207DRAFT_581851 [Hyaloscypha variabilis F]|uniref:Uncharacterized protein n=1 Tax=Hyaloscypha variabilis (strain UAMH 11265 / GT02V1 / F) TaxID=1149755 RepID=A0A2J6RSB9_HYAVF|nr:hypothetical protein L207DRAFT_581851 [Hyaloscypha variabilis F]